ncbi:MAG TPA: sensor histidine kinase [Nitrospirota bacterium]|nr:sensor histidine kinase [Nitrospirota bacterium]
MPSRAVNFGADIVLLLFIAVLLLSGCFRDRDAPVAQRGVIDLSSVDMNHVASVRLDGEWEFYGNQLLAPQDFHGTRAAAPDGYAAIPGSWRGYNVNAKKLGGAGYVTYRLRIMPGKGGQDLAVHVGLVNSAYRLWADTKLIIENGEIGRTSAEEVPIQSFRQARLPITDRPVDLVLQVSNFHDREGGVLSSLELGAADKLEADLFARRSLTLISIGSLMVMGIYHVFLYTFRTRNIAPLYFGVYCLLWMIFSLTNNANGWPVRMFIGSIPAWLVNRVDLICVVISVPVIYSFLRTLYPDEFSFGLQKVTLAVAAAFLVPGLFASTLTFTSIITFFYVFCMLLICSMLVMLGRAIRAKREGAPYILLGFAVLGIVSVNDMLYDLQMIRSVYLMEAGMLAFILFQACALSVRFSRTFSAVERLSGELTDKNLVLEREIVERARLEREIVNTSEDERRRISRELHDGLCQKLTAARLHFSVVMRKLAGEGKQTGELASVSTLLEESVNQAYDLSRGLWPVEYDPHGISPSLEELTRRLSESSGVTIEFSQKRGCENCSNGALIQLYRIAQEAITNAVKHARPKKISVGLTCAERSRIVMTVLDDGIGRNVASPSTGGLGISIMNHRARMINGRLSITDAEGGGTVVTCDVPCDVESTEQKAAS